MKKLAILALFVVTACATPQTLLKNKNGDVVSCGGGTAGSIAGGMVGYSIQKDNDSKCVKNYMAQGYKPVKIDGIAVNENEDNKK